MSWAKENGFRLHANATLTLDEDGGSGLHAAVEGDIEAAAEVVRCPTAMLLPPRMPTKKMRKRNKKLAGYRASGPGSVSLSRHTH